MNIYTGNMVLKDEEKKLCAIKSRKITTGDKQSAAIFLDYLIKHEIKYEKERSNSVLINDFLCYIAVIGSNSKTPWSISRSNVNNEEIKYFFLLRITEDEDDFSVYGVEANGLRVNLNNRLGNQSESNSGKQDAYEVLKSGNENKTTLIEEKYIQELGSLTTDDAAKWIRENL